MNAKSIHEVFIECLNDMGIAALQTLSEKPRCRTGKQVTCLYDLGIEWVCVDSTINM